MNPPYVPRWFSILVAVLLPLNLALLWYARGEYVGGFELMGAAHGTILLNTLGFWGAIQRLYSELSGYLVWTPANSVIYSLVPALLQELHPWLFWPQVLNFILSACCVIWLAKIFRVNLILVIACVLCSPVLLSYSIVGHAYLSGALLPTTLALAVVARSLEGDKDQPSYLVLRDSLFFSGILLISMNCYEAGRTFFVPIVLAALFRFEIPKYRRTAWLIIGCTIGVVLFLSRGPIPREILEQTPLSLSTLVAGLKKITSGYTTDLWLDLPIIPLLFLFVLVKALKDKIVSPRQNLLFALTGFYFVLVCILSINVGGRFLIPHRGMLFTIFALLSICNFMSESQRAHTQRHFLLLILFGITLSTSSSANALLFPSTTRALPWIQAKIDWYFDKTLLDDIPSLVSVVKRYPGRTAILYDFNTAAETPLFPLGVPEQLLLRLGWQTFNNKVVLLGYQNHPYHHIELPIVSADKSLFDDSTLTPPFQLFAVDDLGVETIDQLKNRLLNRSEIVPLPDNLLRFRGVEVKKIRPPGPTEVFFNSAVPFNSSSTLGLSVSLEETQDYKLIFDARRGSRTYTQQLLLDRTPTEIPLYVQPREDMLALIEGRIFITNPSGRTISMLGNHSGNLGIFINMQPIYFGCDKKESAYFEQEVHLTFGLNELELYYQGDSPLILDSFDTSYQRVEWEPIPHGEPTHQWSVFQGALREKATRILTNR